MKEKKNRLGLLGKWFLKCSETDDYTSMYEALVAMGITDVTLLVLAYKIAFGKI